MANAELLLALILLLVVLEFIRLFVDGNEEDDVDVVKELDKV
jgi:hypothetical protein